MAFPVIWLSVSARRTGAALSIPTPLASTVVSPLLMGHGVERSGPMIVFPVIMAGLAFTGHAVGRGLVKHRDSLGFQGRELLRFALQPKNTPGLWTGFLKQLVLASGSWSRRR